MVGFGLSLRDHSVSRLKILSHMFLSTQPINIRRIFILLIVVILIFGSLTFFIYPEIFHSFKSFESKDEKDVEKNQDSLDNTSVFEVEIKPIYGIPKEVFIDSIDLNLTIISVGVDEGGQLESPKEWNVAGWFRGSSRTEEKGNVVIYAHYDDNRGRPAAFWKLKNVKVGDKVSILDSYGRYYDYRVYEVYYVDVSDPDRLKLLESTNDGSSKLTLLTCGGLWLSGEGNYNKRLVVSAELMQQE